MTDKQLEPCSMGVGCDEVGICYANAHGKPENCPKQRSEDVDLASRLFAFAGITPDCPHNPGFSHLNYFARELVLEAAKALRQPTQSDALREENERLRALLARTVNLAEVYAEGTGTNFKEAMAEARAALQEQSK